MIGVILVVVLFLPNPPPIAYLIYDVNHENTVRN